ncbi:MAG: cytoplasmic protein [Phycisphaerales bacterium]|nr:cytoplasmic protein [Phycisphaerales bacterium]
MSEVEEFLSEPLKPLAGTFDAAAMATGMPGLPAGFVWRDQPYAITGELEAWKHTSAEGGRAGGERYLRRHYYRLRMSDDSEWTVYFVRQTPRGGSPKTRWFLYSKRGGTPSADRGGVPAPV